MSLRLGFHPLVQRDLYEILEYYVSEGGQETADRFESEFRAAIATIQRNPRHFPFYQKQRRYRRCRLSTFPQATSLTESFSDFPPLTSFLRLPPRPPRLRVSLYPPSSENRLFFATLSDLCVLCLEVLPLLFPNDY